MKLSELWPQVPSMSYAELRELAMVYAPPETATLLSEQDLMLERPHFRIAVQILADRSYMLCCDVLKEMVDGGLYSSEYGLVMEALGDQVEIVPMADALAALPPQPKGLQAPEPWVQPSGAHDSYSYGSLVLYTLAGESEQKSWRCVCDGNVWSPEPYPAGYGWVQHPAPPPPTEPQAWVQPVPGVPGKEPYDIGDVVAHSDDLWESLVASNVWEPGTPGAESLWRPGATWEPPGEEILPWEQPVDGVTPPYDVHDKVTHQGSTWECNYSQNRWEPGAEPSYGWQKLE